MVSLKGIRLPNQRNSYARPWTEPILCHPTIYLLILYILGFATPATVGLSALPLPLRMVALHRYPEWWVVNSVGVMVGSGVIVMIGISFVPTLVIIFMVLAAIYDYWAVHKSKHMLELADTMIGLKLPVLLVAPKEKGYSFLEQEGDIMQDSPPPPLISWKQR